MVTELVEVRGSPKGDGGRDLGGCPVPMAIGLGRVLPTASCGITCRGLDVSIFFRQHADIYFKQGAAVPCLNIFIRSNTGSYSLIRHFIRCKKGGRSAIRHFVRSNTGSCSTIRHFIRSNAGSRISPLFR